MYAIRSYYGLMPRLAALLQTDCHRLRNLHAGQVLALVEARELEYLVARHARRHGLSPIELVAAEGDLPVGVRPAAHRRLGARADSYNFV